MMDLNGVRAFVAVVDAGSFTAGGRQVGLTKGAVSKQISGLEADLGVVLLHRTTRKLGLTEAGDRFYRHAVCAVAEAEAARQVVTGYTSEPKGRLRIAAPMSFGMRHLSRELGSFCALYRDISIDLVLNDRHVDLIEEGFDVALRIGDLPDSSLFVRKIAKVRLVLCAAATYLAQNGTPATPADLKTHSCLVYTLKSKPHIWSMRKPGGPMQNVRIDGAMQINNGEALLDIACQGLGIVLLPDFIVYEALEEGRLVPIMTDHEMLSIDLQVVFPGSREPVPKVRVLIDFLLEAFAAERRPWQRMHDNTLSKAPVSSLKDASP